MTDVMAAMASTTLNTNDLSDRTLSFPPRGLCRVEAAAYIGVGVTKFDQMVADRRMPRPKRIDGRTVWDRLALDKAFAALPEDGEEGSNPWDA